ncbi:MAG: DNA polymerase III subunit beta [Clostridia bacterium]|nr:DNA polymerase III subunit beta [Deltaproteobacteria bacterium]
MSIRTAELSRALYRVQGVADKKSTMPILAHVLLDASDERSLKVSATDLDVGLTGSYEAQISKPGAVAVHARQLYEIVKSLTNDTVEMERQDNHWIALKSGTSRFRLVGMAADLFPALPAQSQNAKSFTIPSDVLMQMIERTIFCVSTDDNRHNLSGIYCEAPNDKTLRMVATDGHRLAMIERAFDTEIPIAAGVIVPRKGFQELRRVLADEKNADVRLGFSQSSGMLSAGSVELSTRLVEGAFPDYKQVIPKQGTKVAKVHRLQLTEALKRVSLLSQARSGGVRLAFKDSQLELRAEDPEFGEATELVDIDYKGEPLTIGFNARYILDVLALVHEEGVMFELSDDLSPGVIKPIEDQSFLAVVMPMRI